MSLGRSLIDRRAITVGKIPGSRASSMETIVLETPGIYHKPLSYENLSYL